MAAISAVAAGIGAASSIVGGVVQASAAGKAARGARGEKQAAAARVKELQESRGPVVNPYSGTTSLADMAKDLTSQMRNPYANLGVATQAAEIQAEESDIALASTLDTMRATGAGAGGATALAQAALKSKRGIAANIESQEAANEKLRAQGESQLQQAKIAEQQRIQNVAISEGSRVQEAQAKGKAFKFQVEEDRRNSDIEYQISKEMGAAQREAQANANKSAAIGGIFSGIGDIAGSVIGAGGAGG
tara:strand:+ start:10135 stop:10875 length:741 start_codon:yes stop_codon:yes gene_type:complete